MKITYPSVEQIIEFNVLALELIKVKKADKAEVRSPLKILRAIEACEEEKGDIYEKATVLLVGLVRSHPFASGNRRTSLIVVKDFLLENGARFTVPNNASNARILLGIREGFYTNEEIVTWLKHGKIKPFTR
jgi:death-on-curing family protein